MSSSAAADPSPVALAAGPGEDGAPVASLPRELLAAVFALLEVPDRARASRACRRWRSCALDHSSPSLRLEIGLEDEGDVDGCSEAAEANARALAALRSRLSGGVTRLKLRLLVGAARARESSVEPREPRYRWPQWPLAAVREALPRSLRELRLEVPLTLTFAGRGDVDAAAPLRRLRLHECAPALYDLFINPEEGYDFKFGNEKEGFRHPTLRRLGAAPLGPRVPAMLRALPSLTHVLSLDLEASPASPSDVLALAAAGVRVRSLRLALLDLSSPPAAAALAAVVRPGEFAADPYPHEEPPLLALDSCTLPPALPAPLAPGLQKVELRRCAVQAGLLRQLLEALGGTPEAEILFDDECTYPGLAPGALVEVLEAHLPEGARVHFCWPAAGDGWLGDEPFQGALSALAAAPSLLQAVERAPGPGARPPAPPRRGAPGQPGG
eukprot:tig00020675_g12656.t1